MVGSTETADGKKGFVPAPDKGPPNRFLNSSGIWTPPEGGSAETATKALQDGDGNVISGTYVRADGGVLNGRVVNWRSSRSSGARGNFIRYLSTAGGHPNTARTIDIFGIVQIGAYEIKNTTVTSLPTGNFSLTNSSSLL